MPFDPFAIDLDLEAARAVLAEALSGADDGELFLERRRGESLMFDDGRLKNASYDSGEGFGLRVVSGEGVGYAPVLLYTSPSPRDRQKSRMPSSA